MTLIHVPRPPRSAMNPDRPVSALLKAQILYLHDAERNLPLRYRTDIYINAIKTEGEAAEYIQRVTTAIHEAHAAAAAKRAKPAIKRKHGIEIAAVADDSPAWKPAKKNKTPGKNRPKK
jgi:hypothetical protein